MKAEWTNSDSLTTSQTTKAILVIDMPNNCYDCQYCRFDARKYNFRGCVLADTDVQDGTIDICKEVHSCCPLKPMPEKKVVTVKRIEDIQSYSITEVADKISAKIILKTNEVFALGWNACLDSIIGENNESNISN